MEDITNAAKVVTIIDGFMNDWLSMTLTVWTLLSAYAADCA